MAASCSAVSDVSYFLFFRVMERGAKRTERKDNVRWEGQVPTHDGRMGEFLSGRTLLPIIVEDEKQKQKETEKLLTSRA